MNDSFDEMLLKRFQAAVMAQAQDAATRIRNAAVEEFDNTLREIMATTVMSSITDTYSIEHDVHNHTLRVVVTFKHAPPKEDY